MHLKTYRNTVNVWSNPNLITIGQKSGKNRAKIGLLNRNFKYSIRNLPRNTHPNPSQYPHRLAYRRPLSLAYVLAKPSRCDAGGGMGTPAIGDGAALPRSWRRRAPPAPFFQPCAPSPWLPIPFPPASCDGGVPSTPLLGCPRFGRGRAGSPPARGVSGAYRSPGCPPPGDYGRVRPISAAACGSLGGGGRLRRRVRRSDAAYRCPRERLACGIR